MKNHKFPVYFKRETPLFGSQFVKVLSDYQQVYVCIDKYTLGDGSIGYNYTVTRDRISDQQFLHLLSAYAETNEAEYMKALKNVADFFTKVTEALK